MKTPSDSLKDLYSSILKYNQNIIGVSNYNDGSHIVFDSLIQQLINIGNQPVPLPAQQYVSELFLQAM